MKAGDAETFVERAGNAEQSDRFLILVLRLAGAVMLRRLDLGPSLLGGTLRCPAVA